MVHNDKAKGRPYSGRPVRSTNFSELLEVKMKMEWFGFWIFLAVFVACDHWVFTQGYDSFFQRHKTEAEKELQRLKIEELRQKVEASNDQGNGQAAQNGREGDNDGNI